MKNVEYIESYQRPCYDTWSELQLAEAWSEELCRCKTTPEIDQFYANKIAEASNDEDPVSRRMCGALYRLACSRGHMKYVVYLTQSIRFDHGSLMLARRDSTDPDPTSQYFSISAEHSQLEVLRFQLNTFVGAARVNNLLSINLMNLYNKGLFDVFILILDHIQYQSRLDTFVVKLTELKTYIESQIGYASYIVSDKYLLKTNEVLTLIGKINALYKLRLSSNEELSQKLTQVTW